MCYNTILSIQKGLITHKEIFRLHVLPKVLKLLLRKILLLFCVIAIFIKNCINFRIP